jgi:hypothetical protein
VYEPAAEREVLTYDSFGLAVPERGPTIGKDQLEPYVVLAPAPSVGELAGRQVLIADDVESWCAKQATQCRSAGLYRKAPSVIEPDYVWRRPDRSIAFPWSWQASLTPSAMMTS